MSLRLKLGLIIAGIFLVFIAIFGFGARIFLLDRLNSIEHEQVDHEVKAVQSAINNRITRIQEKSSDWAAWDDAYSFMVSRDPKFISSNLQPESLAGTNINLMLFVDKEGKVVTGMMVDFKTVKAVAVPKEVLDLLQSTDLLTSSSEQYVVKGIIDTTKGPLMLVSHPILTTERKGPSHGHLISARYLDADELKKIEADTGDGVDLIKLKSAGARAKYSAVIKKLRSGPETILVEDIEGDKTTGYGVLRDLQKDEIYLVKVDFSRDSYQLGRAAVNVFAISLTALGIVFEVILSWLIFVTVVARVDNVRTRLAKIIKTNNLRLRVPILTKDEISQIAMSVNDLLRMVAANEKKLKLAESKTAFQLNQLEKLNSFMIGRELKMVELKREIEDLKAKSKKKKAS